MVGFINKLGKLPWNKGSWLVLGKAVNKMLNIFFESDILYIEFFYDSQT